MPSEEEDPRDQMPNISPLPSSKELLQLPLQVVISFVILAALCYLIGMGGIVPRFGL
ncbi:hypothetical protein EV13_2397 [Prochlorococcus sp. MIT 0702]|nr:hypothetical protein EV13_2397 [Prochlorococcus sp. MIT 0702]KGG29404.1 hypothetical protein EV12_0186 [Prochlorococcus sp. MIT 0701]KGG33705.1 hypothetical protein EV14_1594 [Prochlorococcus sp. MIT 0703]|tara:strand:- start:476 stop:646 length:171 start_codon:yes stop_codon:yes gene_type:complete